MAKKPSKKVVKEVVKVKKEKVAKVEGLSENQIAKLTKYGDKLGKRLVIKVEKEAKGNESIKAQALETIMNQVDSALEKGI